MLVIETTNFLGDKNGIGAERRRHSAQLRHGAHRKMDPCRAPDMMNYEATINDPKTYTKP